MAKRPDRNNRELAKPRVAHGGGPMPTHVSYIFHDSSGRHRLQIYERNRLRSRLGFLRELVCPDDASFDAQMELLIAARIPFMVGHMIPGASDDAYFWLKGKGKPVLYLEIACGGKTDWAVREIVEDAKEWRGVKPAELLPLEIDLFDPANRPRPADRGPVAPTTGAAAAPVPPTAVVSPPPTDAPSANEKAVVSETPAPPELPPAADPSGVAAEASPVEPPSESAVEPPQAEPPAEPVASAPAVDSLPANEAPATEVKSPSASDSRWINHLALFLPVLVLAWVFWRATAYFNLVVPFDLGSVIKALALSAVVGGGAYASFWIVLFPRHFARWAGRLELLALSILFGGLIAFAGLMIVNVEFDDAPRIELATVVHEKKIFKGKDGRAPLEYWSWNLTVAPWAGVGDEQQLRVSRATWEALQPGDRILFHPHPGWLGWVWYSPQEFEADGFVLIVR